MIAFIQETHSFSYSLLPCCSLSLISPHWFYIACVSLPVCTSAISSLSLSPYVTLTLLCLSISVMLNNRGRQSILISEPWAPNCPTPNLPLILSLCLVIGLLLRALGGGVCRRQKEDVTQADSETAACRQTRENNKQETITLPGWCWLTW